MNIAEYFAAPIYPSTKSTYIVRYQSNIERRLMEYFDAKAEVMDYFQPLMAVSLVHENKECCIDIDFWLEYRNGRSALVHVENENSFMEQTQRKAFECSVRLDGFGLIVVSDSKFRQPRVRRLKFNFPLPPDQYYSKWAN